MTALADRYEGRIEEGQIFTCPDNNGVLGYRRVKVIGRYDESTLILEEMPGRIRYSQTGSIFKCPELNLRIVFIPEEES